MVALIPARAGSKRCPGKNTRRLAGHPLIDYTIAAAQQSGVFDAVEVCTDDHRVAVASSRLSSRECPTSIFWRATSTDDEPDIKWVKRCLDTWEARSNRVGSCPESFAILRPTSPFRTADTIRAAYEFFQEHQPCDSLRSVRFANEQPGKMWVLTLGSRMVPLLPFHHPRTSGADPLVPWHSSPTQSLPQVVVQTSALEMAWSRCVTVQQSIAGTSVLSYFMGHGEDFSIDTEADFAEAERIAAAHPDLLPTIEVPA